MVVCIEDPICDLIIRNVLGAMNPLYKSGKGFFQRTKTNRRGQKTVSKGYPRHNSNYRQQPDLNLREPFPESATVRPKLKLLPRTVKNLVNTVVHTDRNANIFGTGRSCESSLVNKTKRTHTRI